MACKEDEGKCFTLFWGLENISYSVQKKGEQIESPAFAVNEIEGTKWKLTFFPRGERDGNYIGYFLRREADSKGADKIEIKYELAFVAKDGSVLTTEGTGKRIFPKGKGFGFGKFKMCKDVFISRRSEFLPQNTLTARCRIWKDVGEMTKDVRCIVHTRIGVEKRFFQWNVKNFSTLEPGKKCTYQIKSIEEDAPLMSVNLFLTGGLNSEEIILFKLYLEDLTIKFATLRLLLVDASGNRVECNQEEMWFDDPASCKEITFTFTKKKLLEWKRTYLPNDTLSLIWEWAFSKGVVSEETEEDEYGCICPEVKFSDCQETDDLKLNADGNNDNISLLTDLVDNVKSLYDEHFLTDVKLKTSTYVFPAHKIILSASSPVFKAMFSSDMKEKISDCVNIEDLSDDTISRMLLFIYTTRVEDLTWERASHLYVAADKYAILSLKNICSSLLKKNISPSNACEVLLLSDFHADADLKSVVQDYIIKNGKQITNSEEWKLFMKTNAMLAAETLCLLFK